MTDNLPAPIPAALAAPFRTTPPGNPEPPPPCHRCDQPATVQWQRDATDDERDGYWDAIEQNIRNQPNLFDTSNAEYTADRSQPVTKAVYGCNEHDLSPAPDDDHDGSPQAVNAATDAAKQAGAEQRALTHAGDYGGHGACQCGGAQ